MQCRQDKITLNTFMGFPDMFELECNDPHNTQQQHPHPCTVPYNIMANPANMLAMTIPRP
jgi:hypothetical protein